MGITQPGAGLPGTQISIASLYSTSTTGAGSLASVSSTTINVSTTDTANATANVVSLAAYTRGATARCRLSLTLVGSGSDWSFGFNNTAGDPNTANAGERRVIVERNTATYLRVQDGASATSNATTPNPALSTTSDCVITWNGTSCAFSQNGVQISSGTVSIPGGSGEMAPFALRLANGGAPAGGSTATFAAVTVYPVVCNA